MNELERLGAFGATPEAQRNTLRAAQQAHFKFQRKYHELCSGRQRVEPVEIDDDIEIDDDVIGFVADAEIADEEPVLESAPVVLSSYAASLEDQIKLFSQAGAEIAPSSTVEMNRLQLQIVAAARIVGLDTELGRRYTDVLIALNGRYIDGQASRICKKLPGGYKHYSAVANAGKAGMVEALRYHFKFGGNASFLSYAKNWTMKRQFEEVRAIWDVEIHPFQIPAHMKERVLLLTRVISELQAKIADREPADEEILEAARKRRGGKDLTLRDVKDAREIMGRAQKTSIDATRDAEGGSLGDVLPSEENIAGDFEEDERQRAVKAAVDHALAQLPPEQASIMRFSFGIDADDSLTRQRICDEMEISLDQYENMARKAKRTLAQSAELRALLQTTEDTHSLA